MLTRWIAATALLCLSLPTYAVGSLIDVQVMDRATGQTLPVYWHGGRWWVPGRPGARYAVALGNRSGGRALAVVSVDGVNVVSGETAAHDQAGYVLARGQFAQITGWRKDLTRVAAFEFTALADSYAARTGRPDHVGVIGVAVFRERPRPEPVPPVAVREQRQESSRDAAAESATGAASSKAESAGRSAPAAPAQSLGTGHGRSERSVTTLTEFERAQSVPDELIVIHYDSRENLVALGVIPRPQPARPHAPQPFPATAGFVPDPPRQ